MKKISISMVILLAFGSLAAAFAKPKPTRLYFKKGQTEIKVRGYLKSLKDTSAYLLRVNAGQTIAVTSCGGKISTRAGVTDPSGKDVGDNDMQGNSGTENTRAGDYTVTVTPSGKDDHRKGSFCADIKVTKYKPE